MFDSTAINFGIQKMTEVWTKAAPTIQNVSEQYVKYVVTKEILSFCISVFILIIGLIILKVSLNIGKKIGYDEPGFMIPIVASGMVILPGLIISLVQTYCVLLAVTNPQMYVIDQIISSVK